jgi:hypothetical protein
MEPVGSLPLLQQHSTCPYAEPDQSSPSSPLHPISWTSILILSSHLRPGPPSGLVHSGFPTKTSIHFTSSHACYMPRPSPVCLVRSTDHEAPYDAISSSLLLPRSSWAAWNHMKEVFWKFKPLKLKESAPYNRPWRPRGRVEVSLYSFVNLGARWAWMVNSTLRSLDPRARDTVPITGDWVGPRAGLNRCGKCRPHRGSIPGPLTIWRSKLI